MNFDKILNWKLLYGSHDFPGPDGGTCINEAAIVAAGFKYKAVNSPEDFPPCFSRPIGKLAMTLNDMLPDDLRQNLMKYVCQLAGSADSPAIEYRREALRDDILMAGLDDVMRLIAKNDIFSMVVKRYIQMTQDHSLSYMSMRPYSAETIFMEILADLRITRKRCALDYNATAQTHAVQKQLMNVGFKALDTMLSFGNQAQPIETATVEKRFEAIKEKVNATVS